jgi:carbamoyl-phosphate synthase large subunit
MNTDKFPNVDKSLGPEMKSTGEAIYFIKDLKEEPAPSEVAGFFRQVYGERSMYLSR